MLVRDRRDAELLRRAERDRETATLVQRMQLVLADARTYLTSLLPTDFPDVVYLDPMYPSGKKHVLVKKEIRALREMLGPDQGSKALLQIALHAARRRVVVKRPRRAEWLHDNKPDTCIESKKTRYDIYVTL